MLLKRYESTEVDLRLAIYSLGDCFVHSSDIHQVVEIWKKKHFYLDVYTILNFNISTTCTWWVSLLVDQGVHKGTSSQVLLWTSIDV